MGLTKILLLSALTGMSLIITYKITGDASQVGLGFVILDEFSQNLDSRSKILAIIVSLIVTIIFIYGLASFFRQVYEERLLGIISAVLGFTGSLLVLSSTQEDLFNMYLGLGSWIIGIALVFLKNKKRF